MSKKSRIVVFVVFLSLFNVNPIFSEQASNVFVDLAVQEITLNKPTPVITGEPVEISFVIKNIGTKNSQEVKADVIIKEGKERFPGFIKNYAEFIVPDLEPGQAYTGTLNYIFQSKKETDGEIIVEAYPQDQKEELNKENNKKVFTFQIIPAGLPDLSLDQLIFNPQKDFYEVGEKIKIKAVWSGQGKGVVPFLIRFYIDGRKVEENGLNVYLPVRKNEDNSLEYIFTQPGAHTIKVALDPEGRIEEKDKTNNEKIIKINVESVLPELVIKEIRLTKTPVVSEQPTKVKIVIKNMGLATSTNCFLEIIVIEEKIEVSRLSEDIPKLLPGEEYTKEVTVSFQKGIKKGKIVATVDATNIIQETNEFNEKEIKFDVVPGNGSTTTRSNEDIQQATKKIKELLSSYKTLEEKEDLEGVLSLYTLDALVLDGERTLNYKEWSFRLADIFRQYNNLKRAYAIIEPINFINDYAVVECSYKLEGVFRELKIKETISEGKLKLTFKEQDDKWKIFKQEALK